MSVVIGINGRKENGICEKKLRMKGIKKIHIEQKLLKKSITVKSFHIRFLVAFWWNEKDTILCIKRKVSEK